MGKKWHGSNGCKEIRRETGLLIFILSVIFICAASVCTKPVQFFCNFELNANGSNRLLLAVGDVSLTLVQKHKRGWCLSLARITNLKMAKWCALIRLFTSVWMSHKVLPYPLRAIWCCLPFQGLFDSWSWRWRSNCHTCDQIQTNSGEVVANNHIVNWFVRPVNFMKLRIPASLFMVKETVLKCTGSMNLLFLNKLTLLISVAVTMVLT